MLRIKVAALAVALCNLAVAALSAEEPDESGALLSGVSAAAYSAGPPEPCPHCDAGGFRTLFQWSSDPFPSEPPDDVIVTDRPDFTEASSTVGVGVLQVEAGYTYIYDSDSGTSDRVQSFGEPLFRYGILEDWLEFRLAVFPLEERTRTAGVTTTDTGTDDLYVGFKLALTPQAGVLPEMAIIPRVFIPTGSSAFTNDEVLPGINWLYGWDVNDWLSTGGSTQFNRVLDDGTDEPYLFISQSWTVGISWTEALGSYAEWFAFFRAGADTDQVEHYVNGGLTYLVNDNVQLDIRVGRGINEAADDYFFGSGVSMRFQ